MNTADIILILLLAAALAFAVRTVINNKGSGCSGNCGGCAFSDSCRKKNK